MTALVPRYGGRTAGELDAKEAQEWLDAEHTCIADYDLQLKCQTLALKYARDRMTVDDAERAMRVEARMITQRNLHLAAASELERRLIYLMAGGEVDNPFWDD